MDTPRPKVESNYDHKGLEDMTFWTWVAIWMERRRFQIYQAALLMVAAAVVVGWQVGLVQSDLVSGGVLQLLILAAVLDVSLAVSRSHGRPPEIYSGASALSENRIVLDRIAGGKKGTVSILALTGINTLPLLLQMSAAGWRVHLLVWDPEENGPEYVKNEVRATVERVRGTPAASQAVEIRFFKGHPSMHGVLLPDFATVGWVAYRSNGMHGLYIDIVRSLSYPMIFAAVDSERGRELHAMLAEEMRNFWSTARPATILETASNAYR